MGEEVLLPQIPPHVMARIAREGKITPGITKGKSVLLYTDISGFTALTEALTATGKEGIEEVTGILNAHFGRLATILKEYDGILLKLGGDSLLSSFSGVDAADRATAAAWKMLDWLKENPKIKTSKGEFSLSMKAILGGGEYFEAILGDDEKTDWFPLGEVVEELARAEKSVEPGEFIIKQSLRDEVFPSEPYPVTHETELAKIRELVSSFLPLGRKGGLALSRGGEYRVVASVFLNVEGYNPREPDFKALNEFYLSLSRLISSYSGTINKVDIAPQGSTFLLLFGAPLSHEADRVNAARFFKELEGIPFKLKAGLAYGAAFAGFIGQGEYTVIGQRVNTAAKIMTASQPGEFVVSEEAAQKFSDLYEIEEVSPVELGGITYPRFRLGEPRKVQERVFGEWTIHESELREAISLASGESKVVGVTGDQGMGKSRFLARVALSLEPDCQAIEVSLDERGAPYQVFRRLLMREAIIKEEDAPDTKLRKLTEHLEKVARKAGESSSSGELLRRFPFVAAMLFGLESEQKRIAPYSPELRLENLMDAFRLYLLRRAMSRPLALLVDDAGRADSGSLEMLAFAARTLPRLKPQGVYVFLSYNPELKETFQQRFTVEDKSPAQINLPALSLAESNRLAEKILGAEPDEPLKQFLYERSLGNPTVIEQWAGYLVDKGLIQRIDGEWRLSRDWEAAEIPDDLYSLVFSRLDRLPENVREALKLGSVYGMHFPASILSHLMKIEDVAGIMLPAVRSGLVYALEAGETEYVFHETLVREVAYDSLLRGEREGFHKDIARAIETLYRASIERYFTMLALHWAEAGDWNQALVYNLGSGRENRRLFRNEAAEEDYSRAIAIWKEHFKEGSSEELFDAYFERAMVYEYQGRFQEAIKDYSAARNITLKVGLAEREVDSLNKLAYVSRFLSDFDRLFEYAEEALRRSEALGYKKGMAVAHLERGAGYARLGRPEEAATDFETALALTKELEDAEDTNRALNNLATLNRLLGRHKEALSFYEQAIILATRSDDKLLFANNLLNISRLLLQIGRADEAESYLERALRSALEIGHRETMIKCRMELAGFEMMRGEFDKARSNLEEAENRADELDNPQLSGEVQMRLGHLAFHSGMIDEAKTHYERALKMRKLVGEPNLLADTYVNLGNVLEMLWRMDEALADLIEANRIFKEIGNPVGAVQSLIALSEINIHLGRFEEGLAQAKKALSQAPETGDPWVEADARLQFASVNLTLGRYQETLDTLAFVDTIEESPQTANVLVRAMHSRALTYAKLGLFEEGVTQADRAIEIASRNQNPELRFMGMAARLENLVGTGDVERAVEELLELQRLTKELGRASFEVQARLAAARINLANGKCRAAKDVLTDLEEEFGARMEEAERLETLLLLAETEKEEGSYRDAERRVTAIIERINERPLPALLISAHLFGASLAVRRLKLTKDKRGFIKPSASSRLLHPSAYARWRRHQVKAARAATEILTLLAPQNAITFKALLSKKGLSEKNL